MNFYPFHIGDYAGATRHLSWDEDMAYRRMLDAYYSREAPLPLDRRQLYRLVGAAEDRHREAVDTILDEFFEQRENGWFNQRAEEEIEKASEKRNKARSSAAMRWDKSPHTDRNANASPANANASPGRADALPPQSEGNAPNPNPNPNKERENARAQDPEHWQQVDEIFGLGVQGLDQWELEFLHSIRPKTSLTRSQRESLKGIAAKIAARGALQAAAPQRESVWVWKDSPQWEAWSACGKWPTKEARHPDGGYRPGWYFESEWPPEQKKKAAPKDRPQEAAP